MDICTKKKYSRGSQNSVDNYSCHSTVHSSLGSRGSGSLCSCKSAVNPDHPSDPKAPVGFPPTPSSHPSSQKEMFRQQPNPTAPPSAPSSLAAPSTAQPAVPSGAQTGPSPTTSPGGRAGTAQPYTGAPGARQGLTTSVAAAEAKKAPVPFVKNCKKSTHPGMFLLPLLHQAPVMMFPVCPPRVFNHLGGGWSKCGY